MRLFKGVRFIGLYKSDGWKEKLPFYSWFCNECKQYVINYPSSHYETLKCPSCLHIKMPNIVFD